MEQLNLVLLNWLGRAVGDLAARSVPDKDQVVERGKVKNAEGMLQCSLPLKELENEYGCLSSITSFLRWQLCK